MAKNDEKDDVLMREQKELRAAAARAERESRAERDSREKENGRLVCKVHNARSALYIEHVRPLGASNVP